MSDEGQTNPGGEGDKDSLNVEEKLKRLDALEKEHASLKSTNERLLNQSKDWKSEAQKYKEAEAERLKQIESEKESKLREQGEYKQLLSQREKALQEKEAELEAEREKARKANETLLEARKLSAFENRLGGKLTNDKYLMFVNTKEIAVNPETNQIDQASVDATVQNFLSEHKDLVSFGAGKMPGFEGAKGKSVSLDMYKGMSLEEKRKNLGAAVENYKKRRK